MSRKKRVSARDVVQRIKDEKIRFLDLKFVDLFGTLQHLTVPTEVVDEGSFQTGFGFDGSSVKGFQKINESDMLLLPDPNSVFLDPFFDDPALSVFCDISDPVRMKPYSRDPRGIARRAERLMRSLIVVNPDEVIEALLLLQEVERGGLGGFILERQVHALVASILLRMSRLDALNVDAQSQPPHREL